MSITRQQRRAMQRKLGHVSNEQAEKIILALREQSEAKKKAAERVILAIREESEAERKAERKAAKMMVPEVSEAVYERIKKEWEPQVAAKAMAETLIMILAFMHIDRRHTGKYLAKWLHDFNSFGNSVNEYGEGLEPLIEILRDECGIDMVKELQACEIESNREAEEKRKRWRRTKSTN